MRIGVLTGGGDCPGLNAVIRAVVRKGIDAYADELVGFADGWRGVLEDNCSELTIESTRGILPRGGTILGSSPHESVQARGRARPGAGDGRPPPGRRADRDRRRGHPRRGQPADRGRAAT